MAQYNLTVLLAQQASENMPLSYLAVWWPEQPKNTLTSTFAKSDLPSNRKELTAPYIVHIA